MKEILFDFKEFKKRVAALVSEDGTDIPEASA